MNSGNLWIFFCINVIVSISRSDLVLYVPFVWRGRHKHNPSIVVGGTYNGVDIVARTKDSYVDVTQLCQANGKTWSDCCEPVGAKRFKAAFSASSGIPVAGLVVLTRSESGQQGHTFADRRIALHCAAWIGFALLTTPRSE
jgi:hypothetical protein